MCFFSLKKSIKILEIALRQTQGDLEIVSQNNRF